MVSETATKPPEVCAMCDRLHGSECYQIESDGKSTWVVWFCSNSCRRKYLSAELPLFKIAGVTLVFIACIFIGYRATAAPPPNTDPTLAPWFQSLRDDSGMSCCGLGDGHQVSYRTVNATDHEYEFLWKGQWYAVPPEKVLRNRPNPTGSFVVFFREEGNQLILYCAVRPVET